MQGLLRFCGFLNAQAYSRGAFLALGAFSLSVLFLILLKKKSLKYGILLSKGIPLVGGIGIGLAFYLSIWLCTSLEVNLPSQLAGILGASAIMLFSGIFDDQKELSVRKKFLMQSIAASILITSGIRMDVVFLSKAANIILSFFWIIGITNAVNLLDVMDGLAGSVSLIILLGFLVVAWGSNETTLVLSLALGGALSGFLCFNFPPAKIYMGNSGSHFIGILLAAIGLSARYATLDRKIALLSPLFILGFPIFDTLFLMMMRLKKGKSAFNKSNDHLALRFLKIGYSKNRTLLMMIFGTVLFVFVGILLPRVSNLVGGIVAVLMIVLMALLGRKIGRVEV